jgi:hypothetical protein
VVVVCLRDIERAKQRGYRWCGHKTSDDRCYCSHGYTHLKEGSW